MHNFISIISRLIVLSILLLHSNHSFSASSKETDILTLLAIKSQLHDPLGVTSSWNNSINLCQWTGVTCGHRHQRVTKLDLRNQSIGGRLSPYVGNLSFLKYIKLSDNSFHGEIPHEIGRLFRLKVLILANNSFSGNIPTNLSSCSNLITFLAHKNNLVAEIPAWIGYNWLKLEKLSIGVNNLTGQLPASLGNLSTLQAIDVRQNRLAGRIPSTLGQLRNLFLLILFGNKFFGIAPPSIYNISSLQFIYLQQNKFNGSLPLDIGVSLPNLKFFSVSRNSFVGSLPYSFSNASHLYELHLDLNLFSGKVSINFSNLKNLSLLALGQNNLGNGAANDLDFISHLTNCSKLRKLDLGYNRFRGVLPHSIANLSITVDGLELPENRITGTIPSGINNLVNLNWLNLGSNQLFGTVPTVIGELKNLQLLNLSENFLHGAIPSSLGNSSLLVDLVLDSNNLQGNIPSSLENCKNLNAFSVSKNMLTSVLPPQILGIMTLSILLDLSNNLFNGSLPLEVGNLKNLVQLDISGNQFSDEIPITLSACVSLQYLDISSNSFNGSIPLSLSSLKSIQMLDLSNNNLSGHIPEYLENLLFLEYLNISYNNFEGEVPTKGVFNNKTRISIYGNKKLCGGLDELLLPSCPSKRSRKAIVVVLKVVIPSILSCLILLSCVIIVYVRQRRYAHDKSSHRLSMEEPFPMVSYAELSKATDEFSSSNLIGEGSFGSVYKGILGENGIAVAVKVINLEQRGATKSFVAECEALRNIRHQNLNKIITICSSIDFKGVDFKALVYKYMQNGSLEEWLHQSNDQLEVCNLSLIQRLNIAIDVASAIEYLHHHCQPPIVHRDLKPTNVLLDHDMVAHVSDFGLAKFLCSHEIHTVVETPSSSTGIKGTVGYIAPEYGTGSEASIIGDAYSFGILLLEIFIGRRPTNSIFCERQSLHEFAKLALPKKVMEIVDPSLLLEIMTNNSNNCEDQRIHTKECLVAVIQIGVVCSMESPSERMEMRVVVANLCAIRKAFLD